jgi:hypothetical protein
MDPVELAPSDDVGESLGAQVRRRLERLLGRSLAHLRVHQDPAAERLTRRLGAEAFAVGRHVYVRPAGRTARGGGLLAHEATHVAQQTAGPAGDPPGALRSATPRPVVQRAVSDDAAEQEATAIEAAAQQEAPPAVPAIDLDLLAERVYQRMRRDVELERERHGQDWREWPG